VTGPKVFDRREKLPEEWVPADDDPPAPVTRPKADRSAGADAHEGPSLVLESADEIKIRPAKWLWRDRLPVGELSLLAGRESVGKSTLDCWLSARVSTGTLPGQSEGKPRNVLVAATEDNWSTTLVPRLMAAGADLSRVYRVAVSTPGTERTAQLNLPENFGAFDEALRQTRPALVIFSPLMSRLSGKLDAHKDQEVRRALEPLVEVATRHETSILGLIHLNKGGGTDPLRAVMASAAFVAVARAVLFVHRDPDAQETRLVGQPKNSLGLSDWDLGLLAFHIEAVEVGRSDEGEPVTATRVVWDESREGSIEQVLADAGAEFETRTATGEAVAWLKDYLKDKGGHAPSAEVTREAGAAGIGLPALRRAQRKAGVIPQRTATIPSTTEWVLPSAMEQPVVRMRPRVGYSTSRPSEPTEPTARPTRSTRGGQATVHEPDPGAVAEEQAKADNATRRKR
jgi:hypothetical protein